MTAQPSPTWPAVYRRKVRYSDVDSQSIVFNANYAAYFDDAITDLFEAAGLTADVHHGAGYDVVTAHLEIDFRSSARLGDTVAIGVKIGRLGTKSVTFALEGWIDETGQKLVDGAVVFVIVDVETFEPIEIPDSFVEAMQQLHGEPLRG